ALLPATSFGEFFVDFLALFAVHPPHASSFGPSRYGFGKLVQAHSASTAVAHYSRSVPGLGFRNHVAADTGRHRSAVFCQLHGAIPLHRFTGLQQHRRRSAALGGFRVLLKSAEPSKRGPIRAGTFCGAVSSYTNRSIKSSWRGTVYRWRYPKHRLRSA